MRLRKGMEGSKLSETIRLVTAPTFRASTYRIYFPTSAPLCTLHNMFVLGPVQEPHRGSAIQLKQQDKNIGPSLI